MRKFLLVFFLSVCLLVGVSLSAEPDHLLMNPAFDQYNDIARSETLVEGSPAPPLDPAALDATIQSLMSTYHIPGVQACIILRDSIMWTGEYGYMDAAQTIPVTDSTLFLTGSISKTVMTTALMQCVENGLVDLDANVSDYLSFDVVNPWKPGAIITPRTILSHVSGIARRDETWFDEMVWNGDWTGDLNAYLKDYLDPTGSTYTALNYWNVEPGQYYGYSNYAFTLLALVVENVTSGSFEDYVRDSVFNPLGMTDASWRIANLDTNNVAQPLNYGSVYGCGIYPQAVCCRELNGDGNIDLIVASQLTNNVAIMTKNGDWAFKPAISYKVGGSPVSVISSDLDGDTHNDVVTANAGTDNLSVLLNDGSGGFLSAVTYAVGDAPRCVIVNDLNGDTHVDLAVANGGSDDVSILLNNGDGTFATAVNYPAGNFAWSVFSEDLDGDTDIDLAVANAGANNVSILVNNGNGTYQPAVNYAVSGNAPRSVFGADFDGDTDIDLATANRLSDNVSILLNDGNGVFGTAVTYDVGGDPVSVSGADINGDTDIDLAIADSSTNNVAILSGNGDGSFQSAVYFDVGENPVSVLFSDLDGDSDMDLAAANSSATGHQLWTVSLLSNDGSGNFQNPIDYAAIGHMSHPLWPVGSLRTNARQLAKHLAIIPTYGLVNGERLLDSTTVEEIMTNHYPSVLTNPDYQGLGWQQYIEANNTEIVWGHAGGEPGCFALVEVDPVYGHGFALLTNVELNTGHYGIIDQLLAFANDEDGDGVIAGFDNCYQTYNPDQADTDADGLGDACCCLGARGNVNGDASEEPDVSDVTYLVAFQFKHGPLPPCPNEADINGDGESTIEDLTYLVAYSFKHGPAPISCP